MKKSIRIFISSPSDVEVERQIALQVIQRLGRKYANSADINPILWEREPLLASGHFQDALDPSTADIMVCLLWSRMGSPLPDEFTGMDGRTGLTGSEWEFERALQAFEQSRKPELLVYRKTAKKTADIDNIEQAQQILEQKQQVEHFFQHYFHNQDEGSTFKRAHFVFEQAHEFESLLETHLQGLLPKHLNDHLSPASVKWFEGSPFAGLAAFTEKQQAIFFGRTRAIGELLTQYKRQIERSFACVMISGMSGSGKSSLLHAGVLPLVRTPRVASFDIGYVEVISVFPRQLYCEKGPLYALCERLITSLPYGDLDTDAEALHEQLLHSPKSVRAIFKHCCAALATRHNLHNKVGARIQLIVDQGEEIFVQERVSSDHQAEFWQGVHTLVQSGFVWLLGSIRSDFIGKGQHTKLYSLMSGDGDYKLQPPRPVEIRAIIEEPARAAGLSFEVDQAGHSLADAIFEDSQAQPGSLPLVEFCLDELFRLCIDGDADKPILRFDAYRQDLGGLHGAISRRAESVALTLQQRGIDIETLLPTLFNGLIHLTPGQGGEVATARTLERNRFADDQAMTQVINAFVEARLLIASEFHLRLSHESLINRWHRIQSWLISDRQFQLAKTQLERDALAWMQLGKPQSRLLNKGKMLAEATTWMTDRKADLSADSVVYIRKSIRKEKRKQRVAWSAAGVIIALLSVMTAYSWQQKQSAQGSLRSALDQQSTFLTEQSAQQLQLGRSDTAMLLALNALPGRYGGTRPDHQLARVALSLATANNTIHARFTHEGWINNAVFSADGQYVATGGDDKLAVLWNAESGEKAMTFAHDSLVEKVLFDPSSNKLATITYNNKLTLWSLASGEKQFQVDVDTMVNHWQFSDDGQYIAVALVGGTGKVYRVNDGSRYQVLTHDGGVNTVFFSPDNSAVITASDDGKAMIWDVDTGQIIHRFDHNKPVNYAGFAGDGAHVITASDDQRGIIWSASSGKALATLAHSSPVTMASVNTAGDYLATVTADNHAVIWSLDKAEQVAVLEHSHGIRDVAFSPDDRFVVTASKDNTAVIWDANSGDKLQQLAHDKDVLSAMFNSTSTQVITASADGSALQWQVEAKRQRFAVHQESVIEARLSPNGQWLATSSEDNTAAIWTTDSGQKVAELAHEDEVYSIEFSPDSETLTTASLDGKAKQWQVSSGQLLAEFAHPHSLWEAKVSERGNVLVSLSQYDVITVWSTETLAQLHQFQFDNVVGYFAISADETRLAVTTDDYMITVFSLDSGESIGQMQHSGEIWKVAFSPDGKRIASVSIDNTLAIWALDTRQKLLEYTHADDVWEVQFSEDGQWVLSGSLDNTAVVMNSYTGEVIHVLHHGDNVRNAIFNNNNRTITTLSANGVASLWSRESGKRIGVLKLNANTVAETLGIQGEKAVSVDAQGYAEIHHFQPVISLFQAIQQLPANRRCLTEDERENFYLSSLTDEHFDQRQCASMSK